LHGLPQPLRAVEDHQQSFVEDDLLLIFTLRLPLWDRQLIKWKSWPHTSFDGFSRDFHVNFLHDP
jgi:hypothetical protein